MADKLAQMLKKPYDCRVYLAVSTEEELLREASVQVIKALMASADADEPTRFDGPGVDVEAVIASAGAISFFGTPRIVELRCINPSSVNDKDIAELALLFSQLENAVLVISVFCKDKKIMQSKKTKALYNAAQEHGYAWEIAKPTRRDMLDYINERARVEGVSFEPRAADMLLERVKDNRVLLANEVAKLAAISGYITITANCVAQYAAHNIEADVFELVGLIATRRTSAAYMKLMQLLELKHEPVAITAALGGTLVDMLRVRIGQNADKNIHGIMQDFEYKSEYRLQKAKENAARYKTENLKKAMECIVNLDKALKSSAVQEKSVLLVAAIGELMMLGSGQ